MRWQPNEEIRKSLHCKGYCEWYRERWHWVCHDQQAKHGAETFPLISWQDALSALKVFATERVTELKTIHDGDNAALAKIEACNSKISDMKCWRTSKLKAQKHFFELLCPFRPGKRYHTSSLPSPFTVVSITDQKKSYFTSFYRLRLLNPVTYYLSPVMGSVKRCHPQRK